MEILTTIFGGLAVALLAAGVVGIFKLYGVVTTLSERLSQTIDRIDRRERTVDARLDRVEKAMRAVPAAVAAGRR